MDFYESWRFLAEHEIFGGMNGGFEYDRLWTHVTKVNPLTNMLDDDMSKNTKTVIWLECFPGKDTSFHDMDLDCGGDTFEEAVIELAKLVKKHYSDNGEKLSQ